MSTNRVVVTGYGVTSPIGNTPEEFWNSLHDGKIGIKPITKFDASEIPVFNAGEIQDFPFDKYFVKKDTNRMDTYSLYAIYAAMEAPVSYTHLSKFGKIFSEMTMITGMCQLYKKSIMPINKTTPYPIKN